MSRDLNTHEASYRDYYVAKIKADFPLRVTIGTNGKHKDFKQGEENQFFDWLMESQSAIYMWRGCVDVLGLANMYQMNIDVVIYETNKPPEVRHFGPDEDFPWHDYDKMKPTPKNQKNHPKMIVLNY